MSELEEIKKVLADLVNRVSNIENNEPDDVVPSSGSAVSAALNALASYENMAYNIHRFLNGCSNVVTRSGLFTLMADRIEAAVAGGESWVASSASSWSAAAQAFRARAAELGDDTATSITVPQLTGEDGYGVGERVCHLLSSVSRDLTSRAKSYSEDSDQAADGSPLTVAECIRICFGVYDWLYKDVSWIPFTEGTAFYLVRRELLNQYRAMGDGLFSPFAYPGTSVPWSWADGGS